jgi:integrase
VVKSSLGQAVRWTLLTTNPADGVSPPRVKRSKLRIPNPTEMRTLVEAAADTPWALPVLLAASTGMRRGEIVSLTWPNVDFNRTVDVQGTPMPAPAFYVVDGKTDNARRTISLPASTVAALRKHRKEQNERRLLCGEAWQDTELVVDRGDGGPVHPVSLSHGFSVIAERAGLPRCAAPRLEARVRLGAVEGRRQREGGQRGPRTLPDCVHDGRLRSRPPRDGRAGRRGDRESTQGQDWIGR